PEPPAVGETIAHKIHAPTLIHAGCARQRNARLRRSFGSFHGSNLERFLAVKPVHSLGVYLPAFPSQHHRQPTISVACPCPGQFPQSHAQLSLLIAAAFVSVRPTSDSDQPAGALFTELMRLAYFTHQFPARRGLQAFFESTSCKMCLSSVRSATSVFSFRFSSRCWRSSRNSFRPSPA